MPTERRIAEERDGRPTHNWASTVDGWVRDPAIRRHALLALAMVLVTALVAVGIITGVAGQFAAVLLRHHLVLWLGGAGVGGAGWWIRRTRRAR
ncbi:hypothetical protein [Amycolatopsis sp. La24]|uniref:hypothetical protein n=1 Tax=Amycolatopsis sp. La24 TaxID=3028304 RepID=UPI0023B1B474|nr:hypothetical protein [Amycolatopsis sp. La24]